MARKRYRPEEIIAKLREAEVLVEASHCEHGTSRPHGSLGYKPPTPQIRTLIPALDFAGGDQLAWPGGEPAWEAGECWSREDSSQGGMRAWER